MSRSDRTLLHGRKNKKSNTNLYTFLGGTYDGTETLDKKMERIMAEKFTEKLEDSE